MLNLKTVIAATIGLTLLSCCGCTEQPQQKSQALPVSVQGDLVTKTAVEDILKSNPIMVLPKSKTEYSIQIVKPDPGIDYSILQVKPDPNTKYSILFVDPTTNQETIKMSPEAQKAIIELLNKHEQELETKP